jgi:MoaA/NifB/PqqE/SkfB family radical SAM enzyme
VLIFSLDSIDPAVHDTNRGIKGLHHRVLSAADTGQRLGLQVVFNSVATREKLESGELSALAEHVQKRGFILNLTVPAPLGRWFEQQDVLLEEDHRRHFFDLLRQPAVRTDTYSTYLKTGCPAGQEKISVNAYGDIRACQILPKAFGNVRENDLAAIWQRIRSHDGLGHYPAFCPAGDAEFIERNRDLFESSL